jgi:hypothetical protein
MEQTRLTERLPDKSYVTVKLEKMVWDVEDCTISYWLSLSKAEREEIEKEMKKQEEERKKREEEMA